MWNEFCTVAGRAANSNRSAIAKRHMKNVRFLSRWSNDFEQRNYEGCSIEAASSNSHKQFSYLICDLTNQGKRFARPVILRHLTSRRDVQTRSIVHLVIWHVTVESITNTRFRQFSWISWIKVTYPPISRLGVDKPGVRSSLRDSGPIKILRFLFKSDLIDVTLLSRLKRTASSHLIWAKGTRFPPEEFSEGAIARRVLHH